MKDEEGEGKKQRKGKQIQFKSFNCVEMKRQKKDEEA